MFKLVGKEFFNIGKHKCAISIDAVNGFAYEYSLEVDNKSYEKFCENQSKILQSWTFRVKEHDFRVVLEKNTMDIWVNGEKLDVEVGGLKNFLVN
jgi:phosphoglucomutase